MKTLGIQPAAIAFGQPVSSFWIEVFDQASMSGVTGALNKVSSDWAATYAQVAAVPDARNAWKLVLERDSERVSAKLASERLAKHAEQAPYKSRLFSEVITSS